MAVSLDSIYPSPLFVFDNTLISLSAKVNFSWAKGNNNYTLDNIPEGSILLYDTSLEAFKPLVYIGNGNFEMQDIDQSIIAISMHGLIRTGNETSDTMNVVLKGKAFYNSCYIYDSTDNTWKSASTFMDAFIEKLRMVRYKANLTFADIKE